jgi:hypothetical protein
MDNPASAFSLPREYTIMSLGMHRVLQCLNY